LLLLLPQKLSSALDKSIVASDMLKSIVRLSSDAVPNVRFNVSECIRSLAQMDKLDGHSYEVSVRDCLNRMMTDDDSDVRYFAELALHACSDVVQSSAPNVQGAGDAMMLTLRTDAAANSQT
jgi:vesicle coat complex subunit